VGLTLSVEGEPPEHPGPGRSADRSSPNAGPLFKVATDIIAASPDAFPIRHGVGIVVTSPRSLPTRVAFGPVDAMIDVLVDAGILADLILVRPERCLVDPTFKGYSITLEPRAPDDFTPEQIEQFMAEVTGHLAAEGIEVIELSDWETNDST
jgi:hypothetical protein